MKRIYVQTHFCINCVYTKFYGGMLDATQAEYEHRQWTTYFIFRVICIIICCCCVDQKRQLCNTFCVKGVCHCSWQKAIDWLFPEAPREWMDICCSPGFILCNFSSINRTRSHMFHVFLADFATSRVLVLFITFNLLENDGYWKISPFLCQFLFVKMTQDEVDICLLGNNTKKACLFTAGAVKWAGGGVENEDYWLSTRVRQGKKDFFIFTN